MAVQVERKPQQQQQQQARQKAPKADGKSGSSCSIQLKGGGQRRELAGNQSQANQTTSGEPHAMRSMPPNASQSMMMQKQPGQAQAQCQQLNQASQSSSISASQPASLKQQQAETSGQLSGGQRAAFKIATSSASRPVQYGGSSLAKDQHQLTESAALPLAGPGQAAAAGQQQSAAAQQLNSGSTLLECSVATGPNTSTLGEPDDPSECSCSNSFDCLTDEGSQANFPGALPAAAHPRPYPDHNQPHSAPGHHLGQSYHSPHLLQHQHQPNFHHYQRQAPHMALGHHQHHSRPPNDPFRAPPGGSAAPQHHLPVQQHHHHPHHEHHRDKQHAQHAQHQQAGFYQHMMAPSVAANSQHRPLLPHASMPPLRSRNYADMAGADYSPPPSLVRHSTYTATSETITDSPMQTMRGANYTQPSSPTNHHINHQSAADYYNPNDETDLLISNKSDTNFRRSATTRAPDRWRPVSQQQMHVYGSEQTQYYGKAEAGFAGQPGGVGNAGGSLQRHTATGRHSSAKSGAHNNVQLQSRTSATRSQDSQTNTSATNNKARQALANDNTQHNSATTAFQYSNDPQQQPEQQHQHSLPANNTNTLHNTFQAQSGAIANQLGTTPGGLLGAVSPFEAAATFCPPILTIPPPPLPIGPMAITSHRTNSPWMRLSSIILTPVGIVIAFFIVISPLLHYLM